jgi:hypothetical protein
VLAHIQESLKLDSSWKEKLRRMWDPAPGSDDDDLVDFRGDPEFQALLG